MALDRIVLLLPPEEKAWHAELAEESGAKSKIAMERMLWDAYAAQIGFRPRPIKPRPE